jgi:hypothetical protein
MRTLVLCTLLASAGCSAFAADQEALAHSTAGSVGFNGIPEKIQVKIKKGVSNKDSLSIQMDLGIDQFGSTNPEELRNTTLIITVGSFQVIGVTDDKAQVKTDTLKVKLVSRGKALKVDIKNTTLVNLTSELTGKTDDVDMTVTIVDIHGAKPTATTSSSSRHEGHFEPRPFLYSKVFGLGVQENAKTLVAKG